MNFIRPFSQLGKEDVEVAGGKGASLGEISKAGIPVPNGYVVLAGAFEEFIKETDLNVEIESILESVKNEEMHTVENASEKIQALILDAEMPKKIRTEIVGEFKKLDAEFVAVRSSATSEDSAAAAWAGQLDSYLNTTEKTLLENVQKCWASLFTPRAIFYRFEKNLHKTEISVAVVVQKMVNSEESGIAFSVHPVTQDYNQIIIEAGFGLGEAIVSGQITPDSYVIDKRDWKIIDVNVNEQARGMFRKSEGGNEWNELGARGATQVLSEREIIELSKLIVKIEKHYGFPVDVEWAKEKGNFYIVQSRPITTLGGKVALKSEDLTFTDYFNKNVVILSVLNKYRLSRYVKYPAIPVLYFEGSCFGFINNPYFSKLASEKTPTGIALMDETFEGWHDISGTMEITDKKIAEELISDGSSYVKNELPYLKKFLSSDMSKIDLTLNLDRLNKINAEVYQIFGFFTEELFLTEDIKLAKELAQTRLEISDKIVTLVWEGYEKILSYLSEEHGISRKILDRLVSSEIKNLIKNPHSKFDRSIENRPVAFVCLNNKEIYCLVGEDASKMKDYLYNNDPDKLALQSSINEGIVRGNCAYGGKLTGKVIKLDEKDYSNAARLLKDKKNYVLVTPMTRPEIAIYMKNASAFVTDEGGLTCHAAIISRELKKPCVIATKFATNIFEDGDLVEVDADKGVVRILKKKDEVKNDKMVVSKYYSREHSLFYYNIETIDNMNGHKDFPEWLPIRNVVVIKKPKTNKSEIWHNREEVDFASDSFEKALLKDKTLFDRVVEAFEKSFGKLKPFVKKEKKITSVRQLQEYYTALLDFWSPMSFAMFVPDMDKPPQEMLKKALELRAETQDYADTFDELFLEYFETAFPEYRDISRYVLPEEIWVLEKRKFSDEELREFRKRRDFGYCMINGNLAEYSDLDHALEKHSLELEKLSSEGSKEIRGNTACAGVVRGFVRVVLDKKELNLVKEGEILVTEMTSPDFVPTLKKVSAIVTDEGGIACHAAIVSRELNKPCVIGTKVATHVLKDGDEVEVDADNGIVRILKRA